MMPTLDQTQQGFDLLAMWYSGFINGLSPDEVEKLAANTEALLTELDYTQPYLTNRDLGDETGSYGHGV